MTLPASAFPTEAPPAFLGVVHSLTGKLWRDRLDARGAARSLAIAQRYQLPEMLARLLAGRDDLTTYTFNTGVARHHFCKHCGVKSFYIPRSHPDGVSVNARCLDGVAIESMTVVPFDGRNWDTARAAWRDS